MTWYGGVTSSYVAPYGIHKMNGGVMAHSLSACRRPCLFVFRENRLTLIEALLWACRRLCLFIYWYVLNAIFRGVDNIVGGVMAPLHWACQRLCLFLFDTGRGFANAWRYCYSPYKFQSCDNSAIMLVDVIFSRYCRGWYCSSLQDE